MKTAASSAAASDLRLSSQLCFPLYAASRLVTRLYQPMLAPHGLTYTQYIVLLILWEKSPSTVSEIGGRAMLDSSTLTPVLKRLEKLGHVRRQRGKADERMVLVRLTPSGEALRARCRCVPAELMRSVDFPLDRSIQLKALLEDLIAQLGRASAPPTPDL